MNKSPLTISPNSPEFENMAVTEVVRVATMIRHADNSVSLTPKFNLLWDLYYTMTMGQEMAYGREG